LKNKIRFVTAASLYDGHDVSINIMRRILQAKGAEVIHLGHNRSVDEIVDTAVEEDVHGIAISSYQGGHIEFFKYCRQKLDEKGLQHVKIFGGGGGVISPEEVEDLHNSGISKIFTPEDGKELGLEGMIDYMLKKCDFSLTEKKEEFAPLLEKLNTENKTDLAKAISFIEEDCLSNKHVLSKDLEKFITKENENIPVVGITGTGGAGKSSLLDELLRRFVTYYPEKKIAVISIDPTKRKSGGALLGDRIRMNTLPHQNIYMRSMATRGSNKSTTEAIEKSVEVLKVAGFDLIIVETSGIGQSDTEVVDISDVYVYVMTTDYGAATQLEKIDMIDYADIIVLNKFDRRGSLDALRDVRKQYKRVNSMFQAKDEEIPVFATIASKFNDEGVNTFFFNLIKKVAEKTSSKLNVKDEVNYEYPVLDSVIPPERVRYLSDIADEIEKYNQYIEFQSEFASKFYNVKKTKEILLDSSVFETAGSIREFKIEDGKSKVELGKFEVDESLAQTLEEAEKKIKEKIAPQYFAELEQWEDFKKLYKQKKLITKIRDKEIENPLYTESLSGSQIPRISLPTFKDWGDVLKWKMKENVPGMFPFTGGVFPFKRQGEDPTRMFAGEGTPERTNKRFHYLSKGQLAARLSTAFDSVTLYGMDPDVRPDIYGKIGNAGVSIATVDDMKKLYSGFDLVDAKTSVSMTINGPAPMILAMFFNTAIDQQVEKHLKETGKIKEAKEKKEQYFKRKGIKPPVYKGDDNITGDREFGLFTLGIPGYELVDKETYNKIKDYTLQGVRGTVQADILKEDQAQNTCIFSTEFALKMMGDVQAYFTRKKVRNYYSVSISGYHIAEAGANPISQLAFTLANGFTYAEYYLSRGMDINSFAPNLSFFFSNGLDPEYSVIGRVARRIWAIAMKNLYNGNERSQKLKYHIQTSGRSLHAQEINFNDIRTTLQALMAIYDNCNSLHTNAYDEAITTPTEESVRRALAIQMIINRELGMAKNENPLQGSFIIEELTDLVENAVMMEFRRISDRGGVLGAMETMYQRSKIQEESMHYEHLKHSGDLPIVGVNMFERPEHLKSKEEGSRELIRSTELEKTQQIDSLKGFYFRNKDVSGEYLEMLKNAAVSHENIFEIMIKAANYCSLGQMTSQLFSVGGQYRRNM